MSLGAESGVVVYGAGGHGKVVADAASAAGLRVLGFVDDGPGRDPSRRVLDLPVLGDRRWLSSHAGERDFVVALGIGDNAVRAKVAEACVGAGVALATVVHPRATVSPSARLEAGVVVLAGAVVNPDAHIGRGAIINTASVIEHDVYIGEFAHISPNAAMGGAARVEALAHVGVGASLLPGVSVGARSVVGAGGVVARDVAGDTVAYGVPARAMRSLAKEVG